jgi:hypothetical protein
MYRFQMVKKFTTVTEPKVSSHLLQNPHIGPYCELLQSSPPFDNDSRSLLMLYYHICLDFPSDLFPWGLPTKILNQFHFCHTYLIPSGVFSLLMIPILNSLIRMCSNVIRNLKTVIARKTFWRELCLHQQVAQFHDSREFRDLQNGYIPVNTDLYPGVGYYQNNVLTLLFSLSFCQFSFYTIRPSDISIFWNLAMSLFLISNVRRKCFICPQYK